MNRNEYELPQIEVVELELENAILQASGEDMIPIDFVNDSSGMDVPPVSL